MIDRLAKLDSGELQAIAAAIRSGRLKPPYSTLGISRLVSDQSIQDAEAGLTNLAERGVPTEATADVLDLVAIARGSQNAPEDLIDLVTSGPDAVGVANRDTAVVVRDLFAYAKRSVWVAGYAVQNGRRVFEALADQMHQNPALNVSLILDVRRGPGDTTETSNLIRRFLTQFQKRDWPPHRALPRMYYFPKAMDPDAGSRGSLHAKCVVIDEERCFVSSANFTDAAQNKNIEVGMLVRSKVVATHLQRYLQGLVDSHALKPLL